MTTDRPRLDLTPWAQDGLNIRDRVGLLARMPAAHTLRIGGGRPGKWSAYLVNGQGCVASTNNQSTWQAATDAVLGGTTPLSMLRCSECGDLLDFGECATHGPLDPFEGREGQPEFNGAFDRW